LKDSQPLCYTPHFDHETPAGFFLFVLRVRGRTYGPIRSAFIPYEDAKPILEALAVILPADLHDIQREAGKRLEYMGSK